MHKTGVGETIPLYLPVHWASDSHAIITRWYCMPQEAFVSGEVVAEAETIDAVFPVHAQSRGIMVNHLVAEGNPADFTQPIAHVHTVDFPDDIPADFENCADDHLSIRLQNTDW
jgi:hypothetical protein